jgi:hypothetical protein
MHFMLPTAARLLIAAGLAASAMPVAALAQKASPREVECHAEATRRYIEDFRRVGRAQSSDPTKTAVVFVNDKSDYEAYYTQCLGRWNSIKVR